MDVLENDDDLLNLASFALESDITDVDLIPTQQLLFQRQSENEKYLRYAPPVSGNDLKRQFLESVPKKTRTNNKWAMKVWRDWANHRNTLHETYTESPEYFPVPIELKSASVEKLNFWLARFIVEIRRADGSDYPPNTLVEITAGVQRHVREECDRPEINFLKKDDPTFDSFRKCLDARMKELTIKGIGTKVNRSDPVLLKDEEQLWRSGVFNTETAQGLSNCVFFYNCKLFAFRANDEHRNLDASQFSVGFDQETGLKYIQFIGRSSKNVQGGLKQRKVESKSIRHFEQPENERCVVKFYEKYLSLIPKEGAFYRRPLERTGENCGVSVPKFSAQVIGEKKIAGMMKTLFKQAGIDLTDRKITNHSGKMGCCTTLFNQGYDDKVVRSRGGLGGCAVDLYKRPLKELQVSVSNALNAPQPMKREDSSNGKENKTHSLGFNVNYDREKNVIPKLITENNVVASTETKENDTLTVIVPSGINKITIDKNGKIITVSL